VLFDFDRISSKDQYKLLTHTIVPRPIAWVVSIGRDGRRNAAPFSFFGVACTDPPVLCLGITSRLPQGKDTPRHIRETGEFVVNLVPYAAREAMHVTAVEFVDGTDEISEAGLSVLPSTKVRPPRIAESPVAFECRLMQSTPMPSGHCIVLGRVVAVHVDDEAVIDADKCYIDTLKLDLIARMHGRAEYLRTDAAFNYPRVSLEEWLGRRSTTPARGDRSG
jgi:flavin reductase (DIM6/NTAB) family NADH-FMN oxidoreductase RutF